MNIIDERKLNKSAREKKNWHKISNLKFFAQKASIVAIKIDPLKNDHFSTVTAKTRQNRHFWPKSDQILIIPPVTLWLRPSYSDQFWSLFRSKSDKKMTWITGSKSQRPRQGGDQGELCSPAAQAFVTSTQLFRSFFVTFWSKKWSKLIWITWSKSQNGRDP